SSPRFYMSTEVNSGLVTATSASVGHSGSRVARVAVEPSVRKCRATGPAGCRRHCHGYSPLAAGPPIDDRFPQIESKRALRDRDNRRALQPLVDRLPHSSRAVVDDLFERGYRVLVVHRPPLAVWQETRAIELATLELQDQLRRAEASVHEL